MSKRVLSRPGAARALTVVLMTIAAAVASSGAAWTSESRGRAAGARPTSLEVRGDTAYVVTLTGEVLAIDCVT
jgi:hypothetical protein